MADDEQALRKFVAESDLAVSLLPAPLHPVVARACLDLGKHMVTTSYVGPEMMALDDEARDKDLLLLNEIGVDPGIDHMSAMRVVHNEQNQGGTLVGFSSSCGGLPAPEANDNPFGYKFSWSPRGVLVASRKSARYIRDGQLVEISPDDLFADPAIVEIPNVGTFEGYPNRDSVSYLDTYDFDKEQVTTMFRGTLRNIGHCKLYSNIIRLGLIDNEPEYEVAGLSYKGLMEQLFDAPLEETVPAKLGINPADAPTEALRYIGMLSDEPIDAERASMLDLMADCMAKTLVYKEDERDMLLQRHDLTFTYPDDRREQVTAIMIDYGIPGGDSSMARTVSLPAAIAARMILDGTIQIRGVQIPIIPGIYVPVLDELETLGIGFEETRETV